MTLTMRDFLAQHPIDRARVDEHKERMLGEVRADKQRELREAATRSTGDAARPPQTGPAHRSASGRPGLSDEESKQ